MTFVYIGLASIVVSLLMLWAVGKYMSKASEKAEKIDIASALREMLIAKAEGRIDQAEFDRQQLMLHAAALEPVKGGSFSVTPTQLKGGAGALVLAVVVGLFWNFSPTTELPKSSALEDLAKIPGIEKPAQANTGGDLNTVVKRLADKMANDPNNGEGWLLLAKTYGELRKHPEAAAAYEKAAALLPADATMLADWADAYVMSHDRKWDDEARKIVKRAVAADPKHVKALALAGSEAFDRGAYKVAIDFWKRMKAAAPAESMDVKLADANIAEATNKMSGKKPVPSEPDVQLIGVAGTVTLNPKLKGMVSAGDTLFIVAKSISGSAAPLAVLRVKANKFPLEFRLDDSTAVVPGLMISQQSEVLVMARVSKSGNAESAKGDVLSEPVKAKLGNTSLVLEISKVF